MKKDFDLWVHSDPTLKKLIMKLKIALLLIVAGVSSVLAAPGYAQVARVSLDMKSASLERVLDEIESQSEFYFIFNQKQIDVNRVVDIKEENKLITDILPQLFKGTNVKYAVLERKILLTTEQSEPDNNTKTTDSEQQQKTISGTVTDASTKQPMPGVNVVIVGTAIGAITDINGKYTLQVPDPNTTVLIVSFIGYKTIEIPVAAKSVIDIALAAEVTGLDEVVVVGYGTVKRKDLTGAVTSVSSEKLKNFTVTRVDQAMVGKIAGVQITQSTGAPGDAPLIRVRGIGSISAGANPLYVVDGVPGLNIDALTPSDIESIDVLKDASASAIYGSRGANGVIIVNTKRGKAGTSKIGFDMHYGWQKVSRRPEFLNAKEQAEYAYYAMKNSNEDAGNSTAGDPTTWKFPLPHPFVDVLNGTNTTDNDLLDYIFVTAPEQEYQLSASGGTENFKYAVSVDYMDQDGIILASNYKRYSARVNLDAKLTKKLDFQFNLNPSFITQHIVPSQGTGAGQGEQTTAQAVAWISLFPAYNPDGSYYIIDQAESMTVWHPVAVATEITNVQQTAKILGNVVLNYRIIDDLKLSILGGLTLENMERMKFTPQLPAFINNVATGSENGANGYNWINENSLNYNHSFGQHNVSALVGFTAQKEWGNVSTFSSNKYPNNLVPTLNAVSGILTGGSAIISEWSMLSYLGRINYNFNNKYYVTASFRTDGSSRFGANKKWGQFPSAALAWRISQENFLKDVTFLSDLKLRTSYGKTGNNNIGNYAHLATIAYDRYPFGAVQNGGFHQAVIDNPNLTWETQSQIDAGIDISFFDQRLAFTVDYFHSVNSDLLLNVNIPSTTGFNTTLRNIGEVENKGWEFTVSTLNIKGKFQWTTDFNISTYKNKVLKLGPTGDPIYVGGNVTQIGQPIGMFYGWVSDGIFMNQAELDAGPIYGKGTKNQSRMGDVRWKDIGGPNGEPDGIIDTYDKTIMGNPYPDFYYAMTNNFAYKNFTLNVSLVGSYGNDILSEARVGACNGRGTRVRMYKIMGDYWKSPEDPGAGTANSMRPNDTPTGNNRGSWNDRYVDTGTFTRINNITLGYTLPGQVSSKLKMSSLRLYVSSNNPFTWSKNTSFNPEVSARSNNLQPGNDLNDWPIPKSLLIGINVVF
jgi:TonB-linked SusC/RagA family outer membrane protein